MNLFSACMLFFLSKLFLIQTIHSMSVSMNNLQKILRIYSKLKQKLQFFKISSQNKFVLSIFLLLKPQGSLIPYVSIL